LFLLKRHEKHVLIEFNDYLTFILGELPGFGKGINGGSRPGRRYDSNPLTRQPNCRGARNQRPRLANPEGLFARGLGQSVSDRLHHPSLRDEQKLRTMLRATIQQKPRGRFFDVLLRQFVF